MGVLVGKIVLTGGPCAGKTTTITKVEEHLIEKGYHVLVLNECATELIKGGIRPFGYGAVSVYDFQYYQKNARRCKVYYCSRSWCY